MPVYYIHIAVPIEAPSSEYIKSYKKADPEAFMFDEPGRFTLFNREKEPVFQLAKDDRGQWYFMTYFTSGRLSGLKWARQSARPAYVEEGAVLPLVELLETEGLIPGDKGFDKAFAHAGVFVENLAGMAPEQQARLANIDGEDDPCVINNIHFLTNVFGGQHTRYIAGAETQSFATATENETYFREIHLKTNAFLYLLYFIYYQNYGQIPSKQMVPRLLANLWASKQSLNINWNPALFQTEKLGR